MKTTLLIPSLALLASAALVAEPEKKPAPEVPKNTIGGKATITIDVNGQKVTREIDLGNVSAGGAKEPVFNGNLIFNGGDVKAGTGTLILNDGATKAKAPLPRRTWLGVATDEVSPELHAQLPLAEGAGLLIRSVTDGSPAAQADLRINDILVKFDDQLVVNSEQLGALVRMKKEGDSVHLTYLRGGHEAIAEVKLGANEYTGTTTINNTLTLADPATITLTGATDGKIYVGQPIVQSQASFSDAVKQLDKVMHDAGVSEEVVAKTRQAITEAVAQMQKAVSDAGAPKDEIERNARKALEEVRRAIEKAWRAEEGEASKADPR